jgi:multiple sugar transport system permease protein
VSSERTSAEMMLSGARVSRYSTGGKVAARKRKQARARSLGSYVVLGIGAAVMLLPVVWLLSTSLKPPDQVYSIPMVWVPRPFEWGNYAEVFSSSPFARYLIVTGVVTGIGILASMCGSSMAAYAFARIRFPGRQAMFGIMLATLMVPVWTLIIPTYIFFGKIGWLNSYLPILVPAFFATPFNTFLLRQFFLTIPVELEEAARMDGASRRMIFLTIMLPLSRTALTMVALFSFFYYWNEFLLPLIYIQTQNLYPVSVGIANFVSSLQQNYPLQMAAAAVALLPPLAIFFVFQRWLIQGIVVSGVKG